VLFFGSTNMNGDNRLAVSQRLLRKQLGVDALETFNVPHSINAKFTFVDRIQISLRLYIHALIIRAVLLYIASVFNNFDTHIPESYMIDTGRGTQTFVCRLHC
jgi:hypothetical protein